MDLSVLAYWTIRPRLLIGPCQAWRTWRSGASATGNIRCWSIPTASATIGVTLAQLTQGCDRRLDAVAGRRIPRHGQSAGRRAAPIPAIEKVERPGAGTVIPRPHRALRLRVGDLAEVKIGFPPPIGDAVINVGTVDGKPDVRPGLLLIVEKQPVKVTRWM